MTTEIKEEINKNTISSYHYYCAIISGTICITLYIYKQPVIAIALAIAQHGWTLFNVGRYTLKTFINWLCEENEIKIINKNLFFIYGLGSVLLIIFLTIIFKSGLLTTNGIVLLQGAWLGVVFMEILLYNFIQEQLNEFKKIYNIK